MMRLLVLVVLVTSLPLSSTFGQTGTSPRHIDFSFGPIAERLRLGDRHVLISYPMESPSTGFDPAKAWVESVVASSPIIVIARIIDKRPAFLYLKHFREYAVVRPESANWVGSAMTAELERVIKAPNDLPLEQKQTISFVDDADGDAVISGVRVQTETDWLWPIEQGQRYLLTGEWREERIVVTGAWNEPVGGGRMQGRVRAAGQRQRDAILDDERRRFGDWNINQAEFELQREVDKQKPSR